jgi:hypothetical protein
VPDLDLAELLALLGEDLDAPVDVKTRRIVLTDFHDPQLGLLEEHHGGRVGKPRRLRERALSVGDRREGGRRRDRRWNRRQQTTYEPVTHGQPSYRRPKSRSY